MALRVRFVHALRSFRASADLTVESGETVALVGPSGAGKTTVLRVVAGLLTPDEGLVSLGDRVLLDTARSVDLPPEKRRVGYLFQEYALFPHLDVWHNVRFGARSSADVGPLLERFHIADLAHARVTQLSGGERQRVGLARALARDPALLLLDEPLSALDAHTRAGVRAHLQDVLTRLRLPTLIVTHDFADAAALADRIGVIADGRLRQLAPAAELVSRPRDAFVARFTGANVLTGDARPLPGGGAEVRLDDGPTVRSAHDGEGRVAVAVYPWELEVARGPAAANGANAVVGPVAALAPQGDRVRVRVGGFVAECPAAEAERLGLRRGDPVQLRFAPSSARIVAAR